MLTTEIIVEEITKYQPQIAHANSRYIMKLYVCKYINYDSMRLSTP